MIVPVLVWVHGGGFTFGSKNMYGDPAGLISRSRQYGEPGIIVVSINYRLGLFGWLGGDILGNLGLLDQKKALVWVQQHIGRFGGDATRVTLMGESAGAAGIVHHITAFKREKDEYPLFHGAILLSPAWQFNHDVVASYVKTAATASDVLGIDVKDRDDLFKVAFESLNTINQAIVGSAPMGTFGYGPAPDGVYVQDHPQVALHYGHMDPRLKVSIYLPTHKTSSLSLPSKEAT